jgi:stage II sporulation protein P
MYAYRYRHLKKKKINGAVWLGGLLLAVIGILLQTNRSFFAKLGEEGAKSCCEKVLDFYLWCAIIKSRKRLHYSF